MSNAVNGPMLIGIDIIGQSETTTPDIFLCPPDPLNPLMISWSTIQLVDNYEPRIKMSKEMLQALKFYQQRACELSSTVPEAQGCNPTPPPCTADKPYPWSKKKEKDMYNNVTIATPTIEAAFNAAETAQDHLIERLSDATEKKITAAQKTFGMINDDRPRSPQDFVDRITGGKFFIPEDRKNHYCYDPTDYIQWRDPSVKKDEAGFRAASERINLASDDVMDILIVKGAEAGLAEINAFKTKTIN